MGKVLRSKTWTAVIAVLLIITLIWLVIFSLRFFTAPIKGEYFPTLLDGEYSVDGGKWKPCKGDIPIDDHFSKIVIRGKLSDKAVAYPVITLAAKDIWYNVKSDKTLMAEYNPRKPEEYKEMAKNGDPVAKLLNTPGYSNFENIIIEAEDYEKEWTIEAEYPYKSANVSFSECFRATLSVEPDGYYQFFYDNIPTIVLFLLICLFGILFFPISGAIMGKFDFKYLTFGGLCFFWGLFMMMYHTRDFINLWLYDPTVCMMTDRLTSYFFVLSIMIYFKSNMRKNITRAVANVITALFFIVTITVTLLHLSGIMDLTATRPNVYICIAVCALIMIVMLSIEIAGNRNAVSFMLSWIPMILALCLDILDQFIHLWGAHYFIYGLIITMVYQIVRLVLDLREQYRAAIRYQQMQKELYEAKVNVMVSQIRPHFMYNALSSIAMMCTIDPDTAQEATITFADYLRGNMDSLKQTAPVPFTTELEHLKKYLYIEQLRFGKKLNVEYDIQASDFKLPLLSIQPLVENAVKHGVGMKKQGGTVKITAKETDSAYEVIVSDDGAGFDTTAPKADDGRSHIGMENTKKRLRDMCGADVIITSVVGEGTQAKVIIPKEKEE